MSLGVACAGALKSCPHGANDLLMSIFPRVALNVFDCTLALHMLLCCSFFL